MQTARFDWEGGKEGCGAGGRVARILRTRTYYYESYTERERRSQNSPAHPLTRSPAQMLKRSNAQTLTHSRLLIDQNG